LFEQETGSNVVEGPFVIHGTKVVGVFLGRILQESKLAALTKLAMVNF